MSVIQQNTPSGHVEGVGDLARGLQETGVGVHRALGSSGGPGGVSSISGCMAGTHSVTRSAGAAVRSDQRVTVTSASTSVCRRQTLSITMRCSTVRSQPGRQSVAAASPRSVPAPDRSVGDHHGRDVGVSREEIAAAAKPENNGTRTAPRAAAQTATTASGSSAGRGRRRRRGRCPAVGPAAALAT